MHGRPRSVPPIWDPVHHSLAVEKLYRTLTDKLFREYYTTSRLHTLFHAIRSIADVKTASVPQSATKCAQLKKSATYAV